MSMGDIFLKLLNMSINAGWLILAVLCIRLIFKKIPKWVSCLLWGVVAIRLICPFSIESRFSILPSAEPIRSSTVVEGEVQNYIPSIDSHLTIVENTINPMLTESFAYNESDSVAPLQVVTHAAGIVWCCGMILLIICAVVSAIRLHMLVREAVRVKDRIYICDAVKSPFIFGIVRPRIYLSSALDEKEMNFIVAHESAHLKRKDHWWKALGYLLLCIYWFHPLCWAAYALFCKDIELACDEKVAKDMTFDEKKEYSKVLLSCARQRSLIMVCPLAFGEVGVKERVKSVLNYKKPALWIMIAAAAVLGILAICFLTDPGRKTEEETPLSLPAVTEDPDNQSAENVNVESGSIENQSMESGGESEEQLNDRQVSEDDRIDVISRFMDIPWEEIEAIPDMGYYDASRYNKVICIGEIPQYDIRVYGYNDEDISGRGVAIYIAGDVNYFDWFYTSSQQIMPHLCWDEEERQLQMAFHIHTGTGYSAEDLVILQQYDTGTLVPHYFTYNNYTEILSERIGYRFDDDSRELTLTDTVTGREVASVTIPEGEITGISCGDISYFELGESIKLFVMPGFFKEGNAIPEYEGMPFLEFEVEYEWVVNQYGGDELSFDLGELVEIRQDEGIRQDGE